MKRRNTWKRISAWILTAAMVVGNSSFAVLAEELAEISAQEAVVQEAAAPDGAVETVTEPVPVEVPAEVTQPEVQTQEEVLAEPETSAETQTADDSANALPGQETEAGAEAGADMEAEVPDNTGNTSDEEEIIIGDEGLETEALPENVEEAIAEALLAAGEEAGGDTEEGQKPEYMYTLPLRREPKEDEMLPGHSLWIGNTVHCQTEDGSFETELPIINVEVLKEWGWDEAGNDIPAEPGSIVGLSGDAANGWRLRAYNSGYAELGITWETPDGGTESYGYQEDEYYCVYVYDDIYHVEWEYPNGCTDIVIGDTMEIHLTMSREWRDGRWESVEDARFAVLGEDKPWHDTSVAGVSLNGSTLTVTGVGIGGTDITVNALVPNEAGEYEAVSWTSIHVDVSEGFLNIEPVRVDNVALGDVFDLEALGLRVISYSTDNSRQSSVVEGVRFRIDKYDTQAWENVSDGETITALKRMGVQDNHVHVVAEVNRAEEGETEQWEEICSRWFGFDRLDYEVRIEKLRGDDWGWIFCGEDYTVSLNTESLGELPVSVKWMIGQYDEEDNFHETEDVSAYTVHEDGSITLHGGRLSELYPEKDGDNPFRLIALVYLEGAEIEVAWTENDIHVWDTYYDYYFPATDPGERDLLPGENLWINKWMSGYVSDPNHPHGEWLNDYFEITSVEIMEQGTWDEEGNERPLEEGERDRIRLETEENGWRICAEDYGWVRIRMTYLDANGNEAVYGGENEEFSVYIHGEVYRLDLIYPDDSNRLTYPGSLTVQSSLRRDRDGEGSEEIGEYRLVLPKDEEGNYWYDTDALDVSVTEDGKSIVIDSKRSDYGENIYVKVEVPDESEGDGWREVCDARLDVEVLDNYYVVRFEGMPEDGIRTEIGDTLDINELKPVVYACNAQNPDGVPVEDSDDVRVTLIRSENNEMGWDTNAWEVVLGTEDNLIPVLKRTGDWGNEINVFIEERSRNENGDVEKDDQGNDIWRESCRYRLQIQDLGYHTWFENMRGDGHTWVFNDEDMTLILGMENIPVEKGNVSVEWTVGTWDEERQDFSDTVSEKGGYYTIINEDGVYGITLHGEKLSEIYHDDHSWANVRAITRVCGTEVWQTGAGVDVRQSRCDYDFPLSAAWENTLLPNWRRDIGNEMNCYIENAEHPWGEDISAAIENVEILGQGHEWNWDEYRPEDYNISDSGEAIIELDGSAQDGWSVQSNGNGYGFAHIRITYRDVITQKSAYYEFPEFVGNELYEFRWDSPDRDNLDNMPVNSETEISTTLIRCYVDDDGINREEEPKDYVLSVNWDEGDTTYDPNLLSVEVVDNTKLRISSNDNQWGTGIYVRALRPNPESGEYEEVTGTNIFVNVVYICEHVWDEGVVTTPATCVATGIKTYTCTKCKEQKTEDLPLVEHTWNAGVITRKPTCTAAGVKTYTCSVCGGTKTEAVAAPGHSYSTAYTTDVAATCTKAGSKSRHCTRCGAKTNVTAIPKTAHKGGTATCLAKAKCSVCRQEYGNKLTPVLKVTADSLKMKVKQSTTAFKVTSMGKGDYVASVTSSNTQILKVSSLNKTKGTFKLTAQKKTGKATLTVKLASGLSKKITVTVQKSTVATTSISNLASKVTLDKGKTTTLKPVLAPVTSQQKVTYKTSNKKVATVSSKGVIKAVSPGKATITVKSGSKSKKVTVVVNPIKTTKISNVASTATVKKGKTLTLKPKLTPSNSTEAIKYTTSNKKVATVSSKGVIKGVKKGTAIITVTSGSKKVTCKVTVK